MVPIFNHDDAEICKSVIKACYDGGARVFEFTNRGNHLMEVFRDVQRELEQDFPELILGVGSIIDAPTAALFIQQGAEFIVSPILNPDVVKLCNRRKVAVIPGCGSLSEISSAEELGVEIVKIFPATSVGGPAFVKAVLGPMPWVSLMPTGGVSLDEANLRSWFEAGAICVGMGSNLMSVRTDGSYNYAEITQNTRKVLQWIRDFRAHK